MNLFWKKICFLSLLGMIIFSCSGTLLAWDNFHNDIGRTGYVDRHAPNIPELTEGWPYDTGAPIKGGVALHNIYDTDTWDIIDTSILVGSDSGRIYAFEPVQ